MIKKIYTASGLFLTTQFSFSYSPEFKEALCNTNLWEQKKEHFAKELEKINLTSRLIENLTIKKIDFSNMSLKNLMFENCKFIDVKFINTNLKNVTLINVEFENVNLDRAILAEGLVYDHKDSPFNLVDKYHKFITNGQSAKAEGLNKILGALKLDLKGEDLDSFNLKGIDLSSANLEYVNFNKSNLEDAIFRKTNLKNTTFYKANLTNAVFNHPIISKTDFSEATTTGMFLCLKSFEELEKFDFTDKQVNALGHLMYE